MSKRTMAELSFRSTAVQVERISSLHWRAWSPALPNPRHGVSREAAARRIQADLDYEWRTGRPHRHQSAPR